MKRMILLVPIVAVTVGAAFGHGKGPHVIGRVTAMTDSSITVQTKDKDPVTVYTMARTKYEKSGWPLQ